MKAIIHKKDVEGIKDHIDNIIECLHRNATPARDGFDQYTTECLQTILNKIVQDYNLLKTAKKSERE